MIPTPNDGTRPSRLTINRVLTNELVDPSVSEHIEASEQAHVNELQRAKQEVADLDIAALRKRAEVPVQPANNNRAWFLGLLAAAVALMVAIPVFWSASDDSYVGVKGEILLHAFHLENAGLVSYDNRPLGEGDVVAFRVDATRFETVVLISADGEGKVTVHWPEESGEWVLNPGQETEVALPGSVLLDGARGPEIFVGVFDTDRTSAIENVEQVFADEGAPGLMDWAEQTDHVSAIQVNRK